MRQIYSLIFRSTDLQIGQTERANLLNKSINGGRRTIIKLRKGFRSYGFAVISAKRTPYEVIPGSDIDFAK